MLTSPLTFQSCALSIFSFREGTGSQNVRPARDLRDRVLLLWDFIAKETEAKGDQGNL